MSALAAADNWLPDDEQQLAGYPCSRSQELGVQDFTQALGYSVHGRSFFSTKYGRIGLGPPHTKPGDTVCILYNAYTPFIIRPRGGTLTSTSNEFIGEAYVDGLMYGEALRTAERGPDTIFTLQ